MPVKDPDTGEFEFDLEEITEKMLGPCKSDSCGGGCSSAPQEDFCDSCDDCKCEPRNNNGREICFKCGRKTVIIVGFSFNYDYCEYCKI